MPSKIWPWFSLFLFSNSVKYTPTVRNALLMTILNFRSSDVLSTGCAGVALKVSSAG